jgi:hypothetical protein
MIQNSAKIIVVYIGIAANRRPVTELVLFKVKMMSFDRRKCRIRCGGLSKPEKGSG